MFRRLAVTLVACALAAPAAEASRFEVSARTMASLYQLPVVRLFGGDLSLSRRRFRQDVAVTIWDLGDLAATRRRARPGAPDDGPVVWFTGALHLDHDFGAWTMGELTVGDDRVDALDTIPELGAEAVALVVPYGYLAVDGLGGRVDLRLGRTMRFDDLGANGLDGLTALVHTGAPVAVGVEVGLRVRDRSPLAWGGADLDGTTGADCREYVEAATPGAGSWQIIDRSRVPRGDALAAAADCPERAQWQPTLALAIAADGLDWLDGRLEYRRTQSRTVGVIGLVDRLDFPDRGLYPNEAGQAPAWGTNDEAVAATARLRRGGRTAIEPWAYARYSLVQAALERAGAGARVTRGAHALEPEVARAVPRFDADSIWSVFAIAPSLDARLSYAYRRRGGAVSAGAVAWLRRYDDGAELAGGGSARAELGLARTRLAGELFWDDGYGGRRAGGAIAAGWQSSRALRWGGRGAVVAVGDAGPRATGTTVSAAGSTTWQIDRGIALIATADVATGPRDPFALRTLAVLDLAFEPDR
ncbi:MAG: hypothetical protein KBG48_29875 [Kofleriaceae bacterium]|nr:hypothetical protein [Kofleriaceae bacterium]MBP9171637.1 hypothetical protein [Kofleriaceae bacterium]MBP9858976.1 hypothetical protein [Kofleriaceae bacterium]